MLEQYFFKPDTVDQVRSSWLGEPIERYVIWLSSQDYAPHHIRSRVPILRRFAQFVWSRGGRMFEELPDPGGDRALHRAQVDARSPLLHHHRPGRRLLSGRLQPGEDHGVRRVFAGRARGARIGQDGRELRGEPQGGEGGPRPGLHAGPLARRGRAPVHRGSRLGG